MIISAIVAMSKNRVIGKDNDIPWYLPADLKYFKKTTLHHPVIMGRKTFQSIGRPLPKRTNIVLTRDPFFIASNCIVVYTLQDALEIAFDQNASEVFIIGGGQIYELAMPYIDKIYLTEVDIEVDGTVAFSALSPNDWKEISSIEHEADEKNEYGYTFKILERIEKKVL